MGNWKGYSTKISEGLKLKGKGAHNKWVEIPNCGRNDLPEFFKERGYKVGVEIGTYVGEYAEVLSKSGLKIYTVDPWTAYSDYAYTRWPQDQQYLDKNQVAAYKRLEKYPNCMIIKKTSMDAATDFEDNSIDFVYIDGNHSFKYVAEDICEWIKKVKPGGVVCGHDYFYGNPLNQHVRHVVDAYVDAHGIRKLYILGDRWPREGEYRDDWRSWMFFKGDINEK